jgi:RNA polymerase sigma-70 factor (ECF subfamily)
MTYDDDAQLVRRCREGDDRGFEILVKRYQGPVYHVALRMVRDPEEARDLAQTVFLKIYQHLDGYDPTQRFYSWMYRIAIHEALNHLRRHGRTEPMEGDAASSRPDPERLALDADVSRVVQEALMTLPANERAVVVLRHFAELSYQEIAEIVGVPEKTVKSRLFTGRQRLRERLERRGVTP